ncbi:MAG: hypothetical protein RL385_483 [Pseudomonadota bacterium]
MFTHKEFQTEHPRVHVHTAIGKRALILGHFTQKLVGDGAADSRRLLELFHDHPTSPENTLRWKWSVGDLVIWDDRSRPRGWAQECPCPQRDPALEGGLSQAARAAGRGTGTVPWGALRALVRRRCRGLSG